VRRTDELLIFVVCSLGKEWSSLDISSDTMPVLCVKSLIDLRCFVCITFGYYDRRDSIVFVEDDEVDERVIDLLIGHTLITVRDIFHNLITNEILDTDDIMEFRPIMMCHIAHHTHISDNDSFLMGEFFSFIGEEIR
jgi:hypothetical protein